MSISGAIEDFPLKDILQIISFSRRNGTLRITGGEGEGRIVFKSGAIVMATAPGKHADFGTLVVQFGHASQEALMRAVERQRALTEPDRPQLGRMLLSAGDITPEGIEHVVKEQISRALRLLLEWPKGTFIFDVHKVTSPDSFGLGYSEMVLDHGLDVQRLLLEAMKYFDDRARGALPPEPGEVRPPAPAPVTAPAPAAPPGANTTPASPAPRASQAVPRAAVPVPPPAAPAGPSAPAVTVRITPAMAREAAREAARDSAREAVREPDPEPVRDPVREPVREQVRPSATTPRPPQAGDLRLILIHESGLFRDLLVKRIAAEGLRFEVVENIEGALDLAEARRREGSLPVIVSELDRPGEGGEPLGNALLLRRASRRDPVPVILLAEPGQSLNQDRAFSLGARHLLPKPGRAPGSDVQAFTRVIDEFAVDLAFTVKGLLAEESLPMRDEMGTAAPTIATTLPPELRELLGAMRNEDAASLTLKLLEVVARRFPRSILLHLKGGKLHVKGAFGETLGGRRMLDLLANLNMDLRQLPGFVTAFETATPRRFVVGPDVGQIPDLIGAPASFECLVIPLMCHYRPVGAIYADTGPSNLPIGDISLYTELCNRVSQVLGEALLKRRGQRYLNDNPTTIVLPRPDLG